MKWVALWILIWAFEKYGPADEIGPQIGTGRLEGYLEDKTFHINLHPGWADNNVLLTGKIENETIFGTWSWVTFVGSRTEGPFEAIAEKK